MRYNSVALFKISVGIGSGVIEHLKRISFAMWVVIGLFGCAFITVSLIMLPRMLGLYRQVSGGQKLAAAIVSENEGISPCDISSTLSGEQVLLLQRAVNDFDAALAYDHDLAQAQLLRGRAFCLLKKSQSAVDAFNSYSALRPRSPLGHLELGYLYEREGLLEQAAAEWLEAGVAWQDFYANGEQARRDDDYTSAILWYQKATRLVPDAGDPVYAIGLAQYSQGAIQEAINSYQTALDKGLFYTITPGDVYFREGMAYQSDTEFQNLDIALEMYHSALKREAQSSEEILAEAHYKIGEVYLRQGRDKRDAIAEFRQALKINPSHTWAHLRLGRALYDIYQDVDQAEHELIQAINYWPENASKKWPYHILGDIYVEAGRLDQAIAAYEDALQFDPSDVDVQAKIEEIQIH